jgi:hypothetical protein
MKPRGRPSSPDAIKKVTENLEVQSKHGVFQWLRRGIAVPSCNQCIFSSECEQFKKGSQCEVVLGMHDEIYREVMELGYLGFTDQLLVSNFVRNYCALVIIDKWIASVGPFQAGDDGLRVQPILEYKASLERLVLKYADALGIGPQARARLQLTNIQTFNFAEALQKAKPASTEADIIIQDNEADNE